MVHPGAGTNLSHMVEGQVTWMVLHMAAVAFDDSVKGLWPSCQPPVGSELTFRGLEAKLEEEKANELN